MNKVTQYQISNSNGMQVTILNYGASLSSILVPVRGELREVLLGCHSPDDYLQQGAYLGATVGRYANRICQGRYHDDGRCVELETTTPPHQLHGGPQGYSLRFWQLAEQNQSSVTLSLNDEDGSQGFPGSVVVTARFSLDEHNRLSIEYQARPSQRTPIAMTSHGYFNLDGSRGSSLNHSLEIAADHFMPVHEDGAPMTKLKAASGAFDFSRHRTIAQDWMSSEDQQRVKGFDHAFLLNAEVLDMSQPAACATATDGSLSMQLFTTLPAVQLYTGNFLGGTPAREDDSYSDYEGFCLEPGYIADTPNRPELGDCFYSPERPFSHCIAFQFTDNQPG